MNAKIENELKSYYNDKVKETELAVNVPDWEDVDGCLFYLEARLGYNMNEAVEDDIEDIKDEIETFVEGFTRSGIEKKMYVEHCGNYDYKKMHDYIFFIGTREELVEDIKTRDFVPKNIDTYIDDTYSQVKYGFVENVNAISYYDDDMY